MIKAEKGNRKFIFFAAAMLIPYLLYGFQYYPILDDYIQYGCYPAYGNLSHVYLTIGTLSSRPLASILDPVFWGLFWRFPGLALLLITGLHFISGVFLNLVAEKNKVRLSPFFFLIYYVFPLGMEGRYWLSAASRIITGLFFASFALYMLSCYMKNRRKGLLFLFWLIQLISCGFYEPVAVFSVVSALLLWCMNRKQKFILVPVLSCFNLISVFAYYKIFSGLGALGSRVDDAGVSGLVEKVIALFRQLFEIGGKFFEVTVQGCIQGVGSLFINGVIGMIVLLLILAISICLSFTLKRGIKERDEKRKTLLYLSSGMILFFAPLGPNLLSNPVWLTYRSVFVSLIGFALLLEPAVKKLNMKFGRILLFAVSFVFLTATVHEYTLYRETSLQDGALIEQISNQLDEDSLRGQKKVQVVLSKSPRIPQNGFYKDHIKSVFEADWSLAGALREETGCLAIVCATPVLEGEPFESENCQVIYLNIR